MSAPHRQNPTTEELHASHELLAEVPFDNVRPFVRPHVNKLTPSMVVFHAINLAIIGGGTYAILNTTSILLDLLTHLLIGMFAGIILLIPVHVLIQVTTLRLLGALTIKLTVSLRRISCWVSADKFVLDTTQLRILHLAPAAVVIIPLAISLFFLTPNIQFLIVGLLLAHITLCGGDFGFMSFIDGQSGKQVYSYDDREKGVTRYFGARSDASQHT